MRLVEQAPLLQIGHLLGKDVYRRQAVSARQFATHLRKVMSASIASRLGADHSSTTP